MAGVNSELQISDPERPSTWSRPPSWLLVPGINPTVIPTPPETRPPLLPLDQLAWEDYERLCLRLLEEQQETVHVEEVGRLAGATKPVTRVYGQKGQAQFGIDVYSRDPIRLGEVSAKRRYVCLQARRIQRVTVAALTKSVTDFLAGKWAPVSRKFIYATSFACTSAKFSDAVEAQASRLARQFIELAVWDQEEVSRLLKDRPRLVDDFFGREWVTFFCGTCKAEGLGRRLDARQVADLRSGLARIYGAAFQIADSGQLALSGSARSIRLQDRFVTPDVVSTTPEAASAPAASDDLSLENRRHFKFGMSPEHFVLSHTEFEVEQMPVGVAKQDAGAGRRIDFEERWSAEAWLGTSLQQVVVGDPGAGKSTLLRYMIMDLLRSSPRWTVVAERWGSRLPIWLPFHYFTQRVAGTTGQSASVGAAIRAWLEQHDFGRVWPLVELAMADERLLLVVDGLDEWITDEAGRLAAAAVETFAKAHSVAVLVTTRPYGLARLTLSAGWSFARIAPLTGSQQRELARAYFSVVASVSDGYSGDSHVDALVDSFLSEVHSSPDLRAVSGVPLFMVLLIGLRLSTLGRLPERRFEVYDRAVQLLMAEHPQRRRVAAAVTVARTGLSERETRALLAEVAFLSQRRGDVASISDAVLRRDLVAALTSPDHLGADSSSARTVADDLLDIVEGELGLLVRKGPSDFGFIHRMLQDQLAAEHVADRLEPVEVRQLFTEYVGESSWWEILLATIWRTRRPMELRLLIEVIEKQIGEMPRGLRAREFLAEVVFGPYQLPADEIQRLIPTLLEVAETHSYGAHRLRLMTAILSGLESSATRSKVESWVQRWAVLSREKTADLVWSAARLSADSRLSTTLVRLLVAAVRQPDRWLAFCAAAAIVWRCSSDERGSRQEAQALRLGLLELLSDPPSSISQSAALAALAVGWQEDPLVARILREARTHADAGVRLIALADVVGVLGVVLSTQAIAGSAKKLEDNEVEWLLRILEVGEVNVDLLVATLAEVAKSSESVLPYILRRMQERPGWGGESVWRVALKAFPDDERVVDCVSELLRTEKYLFPLLGISRHRVQLEAYDPLVARTSLIADAVESRLATLGHQHQEVELFWLAKVDRGPLMKRALLDGLKTFHFPHWASAALKKYFLEDDDVKVALREHLFGDAVRASQVAHAADAVLDSDEIIPRLLEILRELNSRTGEGGRADFVVHALVESCKAEGRTSGDVGEEIASQAIRLIPPSEGFMDDPRYELAAAFYPAPAAKAVLAALAATEGHRVAPFLDVYRDEPEIVAPFLDEATRIIGSLPIQMRMHLCQVLSERSADPELVMSATKRWADEVSGRQKSYASLAFHRALVEARRDGHVSDEEWGRAKAALGREASCYGHDHQSRRRAAWVGMCVLGDWSMLEGLVETIGEPIPVGVGLNDQWGQPDLILVQQVAERWGDLRASFGNSLITRLSGLREGVSRAETWSALAVVAGQYPAIDHELERALEENAGLLDEESILVWFVSRPKRKLEAAADALVFSVARENNSRRMLCGMLIAEPERIGLDRDDLRRRLEDAGRHPLAHEIHGRGQRLEALAILAPGHNLVRAAWNEIKDKLIWDRDDTVRHSSSLPSDFAVAFSEIDSRDVVKHVRSILSWFDQSWYWVRFSQDLVKHLSFRLRRDCLAAKAIADAIVAPETTAAEAAELATFLSVSVPLPDSVMANLEQRLEAQLKVELAPVVRDRVLSVSVSVRTLLTRILDRSISR
ncbi:MAG: NACHT domain-containing protein [Thermoanaerobaculia bacterium]|nr:NACHT domain-containing protein [Thermoanaerobaculia bacterium]